MDFKRTVVIERSPEQVWEVLGNQFGDAYKWASSLNHSNSYGNPQISGASCSNRACDTTQGKVKEVLRTFDAENHVLSYEVIEGFPFFVDSGVNTWRLTRAGQSTRVDMHCVITTKGIFGKIMSPMMKMQMNKLFDEVVEDFKYYIEHDGQPHPRKVIRQEKLSRKAVAA